MTDLSGRMDALEDQVVKLNQDLLFRPDLQTFADYQHSFNQQLDEFTALLNTAIDTQRSLSSLYSSLAYDLRVLRSALTGHTGLSAKSGHLGGLTGEGQ